MEFIDYKNIHELVKSTVKKHADKTAYRWFNADGETESVIWAQFYDQVRQVAKSLVSLGVQKDDKVNILSYSRYQWVLADVGITTAGGVTVGIYQSLLPKDIQYIVEHSDAVLIFAEDDTQLDKLYEIREQIPDVRKVVLFSGESRGDDWAISFDAFLGLGKDVPDKAITDRVSDTSPEDTAAIVYTSGTTGVPKGAVLTHDNITFTCQSVHMSCDDIKEDDQMFLFLPLAHVFARTATFAALKAGVTTTFASSMDTIVDEIKLAQPDWFASVPRIFEKVYSKVVSGAEAKGGLALKIFRWACDVGNEVSDRKLNKESICLPLKIKYALATKLVFSKLQAALGGKLRWCISGAAPINPSIAKFFHAAGILILEGIGMTENTSFTNINRINNYRFGWVGLPGPGVEQKIADDGEVLFKGRNVMKEYYKMPEETAKTISEDGWLSTGDLGEIDSRNFLRITGRKKDLIITAGGKNIAPAAIEGIMATSKYINQVCVIGDQRKYLSALVTVDEENIKEFAAENDIPYLGIEELLSHKKIVELIEGEISEKNKELPSFETIKKIKIVPEFTIENGLLTPTLKLKKNVAVKQYAKEIDEMY